MIELNPTRLQFVRATNPIFILSLCFMIFRMSFPFPPPPCDVPQCDTCQFWDRNKCKNCAANFDKTGNLCCSKNLGGHCASCNNNPNACDTCNKDRYLQNGTCKPCNIMTFCDECSISTQCTKCKNDTYFINSSSLCQLCSQSMVNCMKCSSSSVCTQCINNTYALDSSPPCQLCSLLIETNCLTCKSSTICQTCINNGLIVNTTTNRCVPCNNYLALCANCSSTTVCVACETNPSIFLDPTSKTCLGCSQQMPHCATCTSSNTCTSCSPHFTVSPGKNCVSCAQLMLGCLNCSNPTTCNICSTGLLVTGGCSKIAGCTKVTQVASPLSSPCVLCNSQQFRPYPIDGICKCISGHLAGLYCTNIPGCTNMVRNSSGDFCVTCSMANRFILSGPTCKCLSGYQLNGTICSQICGDGLVYILPCDDGNKIDGDGCSSTYKEQIHYKCIGGSKTTPSHCIYVGFVSLNVQCINKVSTANQIRITLTSSPAINNLQLMDMTGRYNYSSNGSCSLLSLSVKGSSIQLLVEYTTDLIGISANFQLEYDKTIIQSFPQNKTFPLVDCSGKGFLFDPNIEQSANLAKLLKFIVLILSLAAIIIFFLGSYSHKMIGVQTIHSFQLIFIMQAFSPSYQPLISSMQYLSLTMGISNFMAPSNSYLAQPEYNNLTLMQDNIYNIYLVAIIQLCVVFLYIFVFFAHKMVVNQVYEQTDWKHKYRACICKLRQIYYEFLLFPIFVGFLFIITLSLGAYCQKGPPKNLQAIQIQSFAKIFSFLFLSFAFFNEWKFLLFICEKQQKNNRNCNQLYVPIYLSYVLLISVLIQTQLFYMIPLPIYVCGGTIVFFAIFITIYRPYNSWVHNVGLIINQIGILICLTWLTLQKNLPINQIHEPILAYCQISSIFLIAAWALFRIFYEFRRKIIQYGDTKKITLQKKKQKTYDDYCNQLNQAILKEQKKGINPYRIMAQKLRTTQAKNNEINQQRKQFNLQQLNFKNQYRLMTQKLTKNLIMKINVYSSRQKDKNPKISHLQQKLHNQRKIDNKNIFSIS